MRGPIHLGETWREDFDAIGTIGSDLPRRIKVPFNRISEILDGRRAFTVRTALRFGASSGS